MTGKRVTLSALALIVAQISLITYVLNRGFFQQDDFAIGGLAAQPFSLHLLFQNYYGHLMPGVFALAWTAVHADGYDWGLWAGSLVALRALAGLALLRALRTLFGDRMALLLPLGVFLFTPIALTDLSWWAVGCQSVPVQLALAMAVDQHVRYIRSGRIRNAVFAALWVVFGLAFYEKAVAIPVLLFALTSAFLVPGSWPQAMLSTLRRHWIAWALYGAIIAGEIVVYALSLQKSQNQVKVPLASSAVTFALAPAARHLRAGRLRRAVALDGAVRHAQVVGAAGDGLTAARTARAVVGARRVRHHGQPRVPQARLAGLGHPGRLARGGGRRAGHARPPRRERHAAGHPDVLRVRRRARPRHLPGHCLPAAARRAARLPDRAAARVAAPGGRGARRPCCSRRARSGRPSPTGANCTRRTPGPTWRPRARRWPACRRTRSSTPTPDPHPDGLGPARQAHRGPERPGAAGEPGSRASSSGGPPRRRGKITSFMIFDAQGRLRPAVIQGPHTFPFRHQADCVLTTAGMQLPLTGNVYPVPVVMQIGYYAARATTVTITFGGHQSRLTFPASKLAYAYLPVQGPGSTVAITPVTLRPAGLHRHHYRRKCPGLCHRRPGTPLPSVVLRWCWSSAPSPPVRDYEWLNLRKAGLIAVLFGY